jgi:hypothetical protein
MSDNARRTGLAVEAHYRQVGWLMQTVERFPLSQKFLLGDRIQMVALDVLDALIEATYARASGPSRPRQPGAGEAALPHAPGLRPAPSRRAARLSGSTLVAVGREEQSRGSSVLG